MEIKPVCAAVIVAAGSGKRMGTTVSKQYLLLEGKEILAHTVEKFEKSKMIDEIILVIGQEDVSRMKQMAAGYGWKKISAVAQGGAERQDSIWNGLMQTSPSVEIVLLHDGVRPSAVSESARGGCGQAFPASYRPLRIPLWYPSQELRPHRPPFPGQSV